MGGAAVDLQGDQFAIAFLGQHFIFAQSPALLLFQSKQATFQPTFIFLVLAVLEIKPACFFRLDRISKGLELVPKCPEFALLMGPLPDHLLLEIADLVLRGFPAKLLLAIDALLDVLPLAGKLPDFMAALFAGPEVEHLQLRAPHSNTNLFITRHCGRPTL